MQARSVSRGFKITNCIERKEEEEEEEEGERRKEEEEEEEGKYVVYVSIHGMHTPLQHTLRHTLHLFSPSSPPLLRTCIPALSRSFIASKQPIKASK